MACPQYVNWTELNWTDLQQVDAVLVFCLRLINYVAPTAVVRRSVSHAARSNHFTEHETQNLAYPSRRRCVDIFAPQTSAPKLPLRTSSSCYRTRVLRLELDYGVSVRVSRTISLACSSSFNSRQWPGVQSHPVITLLTFTNFNKWS